MKMSVRMTLGLAILASSILLSVTPSQSSSTRKLTLPSPNPATLPTAAAVVPRTERVLSSPPAVPPTAAHPTAKVRLGGVSSVVGFIMTAYLGFGLFYVTVMIFFLCAGPVTPEEWVMDLPVITELPVIVVAADPAGDAPAPDPPIRRRMNVVDSWQLAIIKFINCMGRCHCLRRIGQALSHLFWVMKGIGTPFIYTYLILRILWPSFVYLGIAASWNDALENINRAHFE